MSSSPIQISLPTNAGEKSAVQKLSLTLERVFTGGCPLLQSLHLPVLQDKLVDVIGEERRSELHSLNGDQLLRRRAGKRNRKPSSRLITHFKFYFARRQVYAREFLQKTSVKSFGLAGEQHFALVQRDHRAINVPLRVGPEIHGKLSVLLIVRRIKPVVMEMVHREMELVKTELQLLPLQPDFQNAIGGVLVLARVVTERVRWLRVWHAVSTSLCARFRPSFLVGEPLLELPLAPRRLVHAEQALVHVVADDVVERRAMVADHKHDHADFVVGHE